MRRSRPFYAVSFLFTVGTLWSVYHCTYVYVYVYTYSTAVHRYFISYEGTKVRKYFRTFEGIYSIYLRIFEDIFVLENSTVQYV